MIATIIFFLCFAIMNANVINYQREGPLVRNARQAEEQEIPKGATISAIATG